jgi:RsiW-degrading membrane proteinase PrsW (M82 family)
MNLNTPLRRLFYNSLIQRTSGKVLLAIILGGLFLFAFPTFVRYYTAQPLQFLVMLPFGFLIYLPTILVLYWLDRREREPASLYWGVVFALILFFCMVSSKATYFLIDTFQVPFFIPVGPSEEFWKVAPLLLLVIFARPAINGTRDGFIYGALGGLGFAILELAANFALTDFPKTGWSNFGIDIIGKANLLGTDVHIVWSALIGAAIGYGVASKRRWLRWLVPIGAYLLVASTHSLNDWIGHIIFPIIGSQVYLGGILPTVTGMPVEQIVAVIKANPAGLLFWSTQLVNATFDLIGMNLIILPILLAVLWKSGGTERRIVREQLKGESETVITPEEYAGAEVERRLHLRSFTGYSKKLMRKIRGLQNELAFRKDYVQRHGGDVNNDPPAQAIREEIIRLRA